jgi:hypothetical protein
MRAQEKKHELSMFFYDGWNFNCSAENEATLRPLCQEAEKHFQLPTGRLYRYFARTEDPILLQMRGEHYRGFYCHISERNWLPTYLSHCFFRPDYAGDTYEDMIAFDDLIFIRHSTCFDPTGCVLTYAHELQHFVQHGHAPRLLRVNNALYQNIKRFEPTATASDIPSEREANIVSKRVAEAVCGADAVRVFAEKQVRLMEELGNSEQLDRWVFFRDIPSSTNYDLLGCTLHLVERYKTRIDFGVNVDQPEWWIGPVED